MLRSALKKSDLANALLAAAKHGHEHIMHLLVEAGEQHMHITAGVCGGGEGGGAIASLCLGSLQIAPADHTHYTICVAAIVTRHVIRSQHFALCLHTENMRSLGK